MESKTNTSMSQNLRIIIMDDEENIRDVLSMLLEFLGHTVSVSANGEELLKIYKESIDQGYPFDLVVMDLMISNGMGGTETIKKLREFAPNVKVILSSGYHDSVSDNLLMNGFNGILRKPYDKNILNETIFGVINNQIHVNHD